MRARTRACASHAYTGQSTTSVICPHLLPCVRQDLLVVGCIRQARCPERVQLLSPAPAPPSSARVTDICYCTHLLSELWWFELTSSYLRGKYFAHWAILAPKFFKMCFPVLLSFVLSAFSLRVFTPSLTLQSVNLKGTSGSQESKGKYAKLACIHDRTNLTIFHCIILKF